VFVRCERDPRRRISRGAFEIESARPALEPVGGRSVSGGRKWREISLRGSLKGLGCSGCHWQAAAKNKNPLRERVSKRVGFAGIRNRNRNRVSRPPAILRVFNGSGSVSSRTGCACRRSSSVERNLRQAQPALQLQQWSLRVSSTDSRPTLIKQRELDATNSDPAPIERNASANVGFEGHEPARFSRQRFVELPTQDHASFAVVGSTEDRGTAR
jgi:hypothetical protein